MRRGPAAGILAKSALAFLTLVSQQVPLGPQASEPSPGPAAAAVAQTSEPSLEPATAAVAAGSVVHHPVFHIIEEPGGIRHLTECEVPTEEYNMARADDLRSRHPDLSPGVLEHLEALEPFWTLL